MLARLYKSAVTAATRSWSITADNDSLDGYHDKVVVGGPERGRGDLRVRRADPQEHPERGTDASAPRSATAAPRR